MKKTYHRIATIIVISLFCLTSCNNEPLSDDIELNNPPTTDVVNVPEEDITGTWNLTSQNITVNQTITGSFEGEALNSSQNININQQSGDITVTFLDNGEFTSEGTATLVVSGTQNGEVIPQSTETAGSPLSSGTWNVSNGILTLSSADGVVDFLIISFSGTTMNIFSNEELPTLNSNTFVGVIPDLFDIPGFEDLSDLDFEIDQDSEAEFTLIKVD